MSLSRLLRLLVAFGLTALVLYTARPSQVLAAAAGAELRWIGAALLLVLADRTLMALRWMDLLSALTPGSRPRFPVVLRIFFVSSFVSNFVPNVAADIYRAYALAREDVQLAESTASVLMDRVLGVLSMALVGTAALPFATEVIDQRWPGRRARPGFWRMRSGRRDGVQRAGRRGGPASRGPGPDCGECARLPCR